MNERIEIALEAVHDANIVPVSASDQVQMARHKCTYCGDDEPPTMYMWYEDKPYHIECYVMEKWIERGWVEEPDDRVCVFQ